MLALVVLGGCDASDSTLEPLPTVDHTPSPPTSDASTSEPASFSVSSGGASARFELRSGPVQSAEDVDDEGVASCVAYLSGMGEHGAVAAPLTVAGTLTSSAPASITVHLGGVRQVETGGTLRSPDFAPLWAVTYSDVPPECGTDLDSATVHWSAQPGTTHTWSTWLVLPPAEADAAADLVIQPTVDIGGATAGAKFASSRSVVRCSDSDYDQERAEYFAIDPDSALEAGCQTFAGAHATPITDRACNAAFPGGVAASKTVNGVQRYNRAGSMFQICEGYGKPEGVELTTGMRCALLSAWATTAGPEVPVSIDKLCAAGAVTDAFRTGSWISDAGGEACGYVGEALAGGVGVAIAGATAGTGAGVLLGVASYQALAASLQLVCGGIFDGGFRAVGAYVEGRHETGVMVDIVRHQKCLQYGRDDNRGEAVDCR